MQVSPNRLAKLSALTILGVFTLFGLTYLDARVQHNKVLRNVTIAGRDVGGFDEAALDQFLAGLEAEYRASPIRIAAFGSGFSAPGADFGLRFDRAAMRVKALRAGRTSGPPVRLTNYWTSFVTSRSVPILARVDLDSVERTLSAQEPGRNDPIDPEISVRRGTFEVAPGRSGRGISAQFLRQAIPAAAARGLPIQIDANPVVLPSRFTQADLQRLAADAELRTSYPIPIRAGDKQGTIEPLTLRRWVTPDLEGRKVVLRLDEKRALTGIRALLGVVGTPPSNARVTIDGAGVVLVVASVDGTSCCEPSSVAKIERSLGRAQTQPIDLDLVRIEPKVTTEEVEALGIREPIGSYTTRHAAGEARVRNIHRIADMLRGTISPPGATFSVNRTIGPRTAEKGFVNAPSIVDGVFEDSVGGGISQFATTLFNAAFFAGLDLVDYQSHSQYIKRYPYGREATLGYDRPDLKIRNSTPHGVMIWPIYSGSSISVTLYSTQYAKGSQTSQNTEKVGTSCTRVSTVRLRTYVDGSTKTDRVTAVYRPKEGVDCNGNPTAGASTTTTQVRPTTTQVEDGEVGDTVPAIDPGDSGVTNGGAVTVVTARPTTPPTSPPTSTTTPSAPATSTPSVSTPSVSTPSVSTPPGSSSPPVPAGGNGAVSAGRPPVTGVSG